MKKYCKRWKSSIVFVSFFLLLIGFAANFTKIQRIFFSSVPSGHVNERTVVTRSEYAKISIHNRDMLNLIDLFEPFDLSVELDKKGARIIEIGCGEGNTLLEILAKNPSIEASCLNAPKSVYTNRLKGETENANYGVLLESKGRSSWQAVCDEYNISCNWNKYPSIRYGLAEAGSVQFDTPFDVIFSRGALYYVQDRTVWKSLFDKLENSLKDEGKGFFQILFHIRKSVSRRDRKNVDIIVSAYVSKNAYVHLYWSPERYEPGIGDQFSSINMVMFKKRNNVELARNDRLVSLSQPKSCLGRKDTKSLEKMVLEVGNRKKGANVVQGISSYILKSVPLC